MPQPSPQHVVLIVGGAVAGSEAAFRFAERGIRCVVLDQNDRPYGKIEDGLPRWHVNLRAQEEKKIDDKLAHPLVHFVPRTKLGRDLQLQDGLQWGPSAIVLATGAWRDRPLPLPGIDGFVGRGLHYQNPLVCWFNHYPEDDYHGPSVEPTDGALIVGGGLASLDVVKIVMLETVQRRLLAQGHEVALYELERTGIGKSLDALGLRLSDLGLQGCTLIYRRRVEDMPLLEIPEGATPAQAEKARATRRRLLENFRDKYLFAFHDQRVPVGYRTADGRLSGLTLAATEMQHGRLATLEGTAQAVSSPMIVSSIGSIPEPIPGIAERGELYDFSDRELGRIAGYDTVFGAGNAITGKGNIAASRRHSIEVATRLIEEFLGLGEGMHAGEEQLLESITTPVDDSVHKIADWMGTRPPLDNAQIEAIMRRVRTRQQAVGYTGAYRDWIRRHAPADAA